MKNKKLTTKDRKKAEERSLLDRVVMILEQARANVVRTVNSSMVTAYWLIGREIVLELQGGDERAEYGEQVIENLSSKLNARYGKGFSVANLKNFRQFYSTYSDRLEKKSYPGGSQLLLPHEISYPGGSELSDQQKLYPTGGEFTAAAQKGRPAGDESAQYFNPHLGWSHYRALMRVNKPEVRHFYEKEAFECGWSKAQLERQIHTSYYERILKSRGRDGLLPTNRERLLGEVLSPVHLLKSPYVLEFLDLPDIPSLHEKDLEKIQRWARGLRNRTMWMPMT